MSRRYKGGRLSATAATTSTSVASGIWTVSQNTQAVASGLWPRSPGAPTIGTATAVSYSSATVAFTAPTDLGTGAITYTATSSPGGLTGTGTSPITVSGLSGSTSYTFTVTAATPGGTGPSSAASNSITTPVAPPTVIGQAYGGGYYAGKIAVSGGGVATHYLIVGPLASAQNSSKAYGTSGADTGATSNIDGPTNSATLEAYNAPAADFCEALSIGGYTDWYLPAKNELEVCYFFLKPDTNSNNTSWGANANAVSPEPISTNYSVGSPAQTSATAFRTSGSEAFATEYYWSSTEASSTAAWIQSFSMGLQDPDNKNNARYVRAVRRVAV